MTRIHIVSGVTLYLRKAIYRTIGIDKVRHSEQSNVNVRDDQDINGRQDIQDIQGCHESQDYKGSGRNNWGSDSHNEYYNGKYEFLSVLLFILSIVGYIWLQN